MNVLAQLFGLMALICLILSMQQNNKKSLLKIQISSNILYSVQYFLLNAVSATCINFISLFRCIMFYNDSQKNQVSSKLFLCLFIILILSLGIVTFDGYYSLIPIIIAIIYTVAVWQSNMSAFRVISFIVAIGWIFYNIKVGAYVATIGSIIELVSALIAIIRLDIRKKISI